MSTRATRPRWVRLERLRTARGWQQADLADQLGISKPYMSQLESGARRCRPDLLVRIAALFDVDPEELDASKPKVIYPSLPVQRAKRLPDHSGDGTAA